MIKNWHKWFICIFAAVFISIFFVYDAVFFNAGADDLEVVPPPIVIEDEELGEDNSSIVTPDESESDEKLQENIPSYINGYTCLNDAFERFDNCTKYTLSFASSGTSLGIVQNIKGVNKLDGTNRTVETYAFCESSLGQTWYERVTTTDHETFELIKTKNVDKNFNYNLDGATYTTYNKEEMLKNYRNRVQIFSLRPQQGIDKLVQFDRDSDKKYYIAKFVLNIDKLQESHINTIKRETGAKSVDYKSISITYYISKTTGTIEQMEQEEFYEMDVGIDLDIKYKYVCYLKC